MCSHFLAHHIPLFSGGLIQKFTLLDDGNRYSDVRARAHECLDSKIYDFMGILNGPDSKIINNYRKSSIDVVGTRYQLIPIGFCPYPISFDVMELS